MRKDWINPAINIIIIIGIFIFLTYIIQTNMSFFKTYFDLGLFGMLIFFIILILSIVVVPIAAFPLFPLASSLWGWVITGTLGVIGFTLGSVISFVIARKYGVDLVKKFLPIEKIYKLEKKIPKEHLFWTVVFFTMVVAMDGIGYILGLLSKMSLRDYTLATIIGLIPYSFALAYLGSAPYHYTILFLLLWLIILAIGVIIAYYTKEIKKRRAKKIENINPKN